MAQEIQLEAGIALAPAIQLTAGQLTCFYEAGKLRYIRKGDTEILRTIYPAVRNEHWATLSCTIDDEQIQTSQHGFTIRYTAVYLLEEPVYKASFIIEGHADNRIVFSMKGSAITAFKKNRIGLCIHHPIKECSGRMVTIKNPGGALQQSGFPVLISPQPPFTGIREMQWTTGNNSLVQLFFEGDVFETEDQRNWSDSSYKTYSTPLAIPFPVMVQPGDTIMQQITLHVPGGIADVEQAFNQPREEKIPFPLIGYCRSNPALLTPATISLFQKIPFHHYRFTLRLEDADWPQQWEAAINEARLLHTLLELVIVFPGNHAAAFALLQTLLPPYKEWIYSILVLQNDTAVTPPALMATVYPSLKNILAGTLVGYGTDGFFADLNRSRPGEIPFDFLSFHLHPQVHAADNRSILENLENQADLVATAASFAKGKPVFVSPITFKDRYASALPDERQHSGLLAWWTLMSIQQLAHAGSITLYELAGKNGLLSIAGELPVSANQLQTSPLYDVLAIIHRFQPRWIVTTNNERQALPVCMVLENADGKRLTFNAPEALCGYNR